MEQQEKVKSFTFVNDLKGRKWWFWVIVVMVVGAIGSMFDTTSPQPSQNAVAESIPDTNSFSALARARFDDILSASPELEGIACVDNDCGYVAYFDYKTIPSDLEFVIRGNAATFSKFKMDKTGVSHVTVIARVNGRDVLTCQAAQGTVTGCK